MWSARSVPVVASGVGLPSALGRYQILKPLAIGGMAEVLLARATGLEGFERHVVIKRIRPQDAADPDFVKMFLHEARLAAKLHHHHIVQVYDIGSDQGEYFFAMEYVHGQDLRQILTHAVRNKQRVPYGVVATVVIGASAGLHHAHEQLLIHRDVTPSNILVGYDGNVKVVDFGIAKAVMDGPATKVGILKGKTSYMSPEQCKGETLDRRTDVFGLGIVAFELATGRRLFKAKSDLETLKLIVEHDAPSPRTIYPDFPVELEAIILKALQRRRETRFQTAAELGAALEEYASNARLRTTGPALATYMENQFGRPLEPWLADSQLSPRPIDFDEPTTTSTDFEHEDATRRSGETPQIEDRTVQLRPRTPTGPTTIEGARLPDAIASRPRSSPAIEDRDAGDFEHEAQTVTTPPRFAALTERAEADASPIEQSVQIEVTPAAVPMQPPASAPHAVVAPPPAYTTAPLPVVPPPIMYSPARRHVMSHRRTERARLIVIVVGAALLLGLVGAMAGLVLSP
jgi:serine/threonine-protein kinase